MKVDPSVAAGEKSLLSRSDIKDFIDLLSKKVEVDRMSRGKWQQAQRSNYERRYALVGRGTDWPWPGASDVVIPMSDMIIDRLKPALIGLIYNSNPIVSFQPVQPEQADKGLIAQHFFDWMIRNRIPNFGEQITIGCDDLLMKGFCILKTSYVWETETVHAVIQKNELPGRLRKFSVLQEGNSADADRLFLASSGGQAAVTKEEFDKLRTQIEALVSAEYGLDEEEPVDRRALSKIMTFLRSGEEKVMVKFREVRRDYPAVFAVDPMDLFVPDYTRGIEEATRITHRMWMTREGLERKVRDAKWNSEAAEMILDDKKYHKQNQTFYASLDNLTQSQIWREGLMGQSGDELIEVYETCAYYDIDGDSVGERVVITWNPASKLPLKFIALPYDHGQWPYTQIGFELNDGRFFSPRGVPEKIKDLEEEITHQHRSKLNRMTIANSPTFKYRKGSGFNPSRVRFVPGDFYGVQRMDDFDVVQVPNLDVSFDREESILRATIESYVGTSDFAVSSPLSKPSEPRTATEINLVQDVSQRALGYRSTLFQQGMKRVYGQLWDLWLQYGPDEVYVRVANDEPIKVTRRELQGDYDMVPTGTAGNTNPQAEAQKYLQLFQILAQATPVLQADPTFAVSLGPLIQRIAQKMDGVYSKEFIRRRSPEELQQIQAQAQQSAAVAQNQPVPLGALLAKIKEAEAGAPYGGAQNVASL